MMSLDECKEHAANGEPCQMMTPDGKWVPFDETQVITKFRVAPRLFDNSGPRIVMYALLRLEKWLNVISATHHCGLTCRNMASRKTGL